jgi:uncharacterized protein (TIGR00255 family)
MTLKSMTGFARADGAYADSSWYWEARSVNGRNLDLRLRLPPGFEWLEIRARGLCQEKLARGNVAVTLGIKREGALAEIHLNEVALAHAQEVAARAQELTGLSPARLDTLLALKGVVETIEAGEDEQARDALGHALIAGLAAALDKLVAARAAEGERLARVIEAQIASIASLTPAAVAARLAEQVAKLSEAGSGLDPERLHQEAVLLAAKVDIQEELDRLRAHVGAANELIAEREPAGRKFEFLAQELNREANTICSKAADIEISRTGLELKAVIDQLREQVQNIE